MENQNLTPEQRQQAAVAMAKVTLPGVIAILKTVLTAINSLGPIMRWLFPKHSALVDKLEHAIEQLQSILNNI